ncbi:zinc ABC transporter substrate-binding protein [Inquilinus sp. CAU 1745]|uniref:metal ABC transporter solute-binding protein, Zn/Mn family n=1 Tax=Inquilinus sp. CAU 1745 TaxID=3140369 RepID=UPI00325C004B
MNSCSKSFGVLTFAAALISPPAWAEDTVPHIVTTTAQVADAAEAVAGELATVESLMGEGVDPHLYRATRSDMARLMAADLVLLNGLFLEGRLGDSLARLEQAGKPVIAVGATVDEEDLTHPPEFKGHYDPHIWMDPEMWAQVVDGIAAELSATWPANAETFAANAAAYKQELQELDEYAAEALATVPESSRVLITAHDAFGYFGRAYDMEVVGIQGISTDSEAGLARIEMLVDLIVEREIAAVFVESTVSPRNVRALIDGAAAQGHEVEIGGQLYSDAMGAPGTYEGTYIGMFDHNVTIIVRALGGETPAGGLNGRLAALAR